MKSVIISLAEASGVSVSGHIKFICSFLSSPFGGSPIVEQLFIEICRVDSKQLNKFKHNYPKLATDKAQRNLLQKLLKNYISVSIFNLINTILIIFLIDICRKIHLMELELKNIKLEISTIKYSKIRLWHQIILVMKNLV